MADCPYDHCEAADRRPLCRFALRGVCRFGTRCRNRHPPPPAAAAAAADDDPEVAEVQAHAQAGLGATMELFRTAESAGAMPSGEGANCMPPPDYAREYSSLLLLGEGDFTFAAALATRRRARTATLVATSLIGSEAEVIDAHPRAAAHAIESLRSTAGATIRFGVDAAALDREGSPLDGADCAVWNFPFCGVESAEPNQLLLRSFFASIARHAERALSTHGDPPGARAVAPAVHVTVGIHQFADWALLAAAHDSFLTLVAVHEFDHARDYEGYAPVRNDRDESFDVGQVRTYAFEVDEARLRSAVLTAEAETGGAREGEQR